jgi:hypothetical protein
MMSFLKMTKHSPAPRFKASQARLRVLAFLGAVGVLGSVSVLGSVGIAQASPEFPAELKEVAGMDCKPACTICHTTNPGSSGTAEQPFAITMSELGLNPGDTDSVRTAFEELQRLSSGNSGMGGAGPGIDSDGDGTSDVDELTADGASDPSARGVGAPCAAEILYGCSAVEEPAPRDSDSHLVWTLLIFALGLGLWVRRLSVRRV